MLTALLVIMLLAALFTIPTWPYSRNWGYYPSGGIGFLAAVLLLILLFRP
jgi:hypothetical protein